MAELTFRSTYKPSIAGYATGATTAYQTGGSSYVPQNLQQVTTVGNETNLGIVLANTNGTPDKITVYTDADGNLRVTGSIIAEGDVMAYATGAALPATIWEQLGLYVDGITVDFIGNKLVAIGGGGGGIEEAPVDGSQYARKDAGWEIVAPGGDAISEIAPYTVAATEKTTPVDADLVGIVDSAASNIWKKLSWANVKATLKSYFDTIYNYTAGDGLTKTGNVIKLGGDYSLSGNISLRNAQFQIKGYNAANSLYCWLRFNPSTGSLDLISGPNGSNQTRVYLSHTEAKFGALVSGSMQELVAKVGFGLYFSNTAAWDGVKYDSTYTLPSLTNDYTIPHILWIKNYINQYFTGTLSPTPTAAEIVAIIGAASTVPAGYKATIEDTTNGPVIQVTSNGTSWYYTILTLAV